MTTARTSPARQRFDDALRFSTALNETLSASGILDQLRPQRRLLVLRQNRTFMLLVTVGAFDAFTTERCRELKVRPKGLSGSRQPKRFTPDHALFHEKVHALRAPAVPQTIWVSRVDDAYELYYKARTLWIHGAGMPGAVRDPPKDLSVFDQGPDGRCWVSEQLWSGCVRALEGLANDCR